MDNILEKDKIHKIDLNTNIYSTEAIKKAAFELSGQAWINIKSVNNQQVTIFIQEKDCSECSGLIESIFLNKALEHQMRIDVTKEFKIIREMIVAQAFEPCKNLSEVIDRLVHEE